ncbi:Alanyl-tRNA synthetase [Gigaspora margarita]|uniref:alanine--tRNA ligase n=1 Tax=Gigaspora margarita TaxID=4874 RepID=A0A8H4EVD1_GIGMA|nr:Alanyl-tRNA synthetase [Gigaspora margarita]
MIQKAKLRRQNQSITFNELAHVELILNEFIKKNKVVYSKDVLLAVAKTIHELYAIFGEVYPDPVRVVSSEYSVNDIMQEISNPK